MAGTFDGQRQLIDIINPDDGLRAASSPSRLSRFDPQPSSAALISWRQSRQSDHYPRT